MTRKSRREIERVLAELRPGDDGAGPPERFIQWGEHKDATDAEIARAWLRVCAETTGKTEPMSTAYIMSLDGELFDVDDAEAIEEGSA